MIEEVVEGESPPRAVIIVTPGPRFALDQPRVDWLQTPPDDQTAQAVLGTVETKPGAPGRPPTSSPWRGGSSPASPAGATPTPPSSPVAWSWITPSFWSSPPTASTPGIWSGWTACGWRPGADPPGLGRRPRTLDRGRRLRSR
ncbi:hypothetical protein [Brevundimonas denitrificans]|uniref:hypothetical protein n=1 Tax=Brevundimonas denitrificans TaxID=1443434 RepID=UPI00223A7114|nr:hypothetical protein [Brevundimonas denitrificans]